METVCSWGCPLELLLRGAFRHLAVLRAIRANERLKGAQRAMIGIIGGTGLYAMQELQTPRARVVSTPFWALKSLGVRTVIGVSAVGSLRAEIHPGELALPSQYLDFTRGTRAASFFGGGLVAHISSAQPACRATAALIARVARAGGVALHEDKTYACVEGPRLGTRAESLFLRAAGADVVGMTNVPEAFLALEAQLGYCTIAVATDYDSWLEDPAQHASAEQILQLFRANLERVQQLLAAAVAEHQEDESRPCRQALRGALVTPREQMSAAQRALVEFLQS